MGIIRFFNSFNESSDSSINQNIFIIQDIFDDMDLEYDICSKSIPTRKGKNGQNVTAIVINLNLYKNKTYGNDDVVKFVEDLISKTYEDKNPILKRIYQLTGYRLYDTNVISDRLMSGFTVDLIFTKR